MTQKVVSKAEGAIVDLDTIEPRPEAVAFAERWDRDPRQIEVVLREARRVVRMEHGVLITETEHGFICANGGDRRLECRAGQRPRRDPPAARPRCAPRGRSATAVRARFGVDVPVIVSDSFGRPWRWGITDVAIGVSGPRSRSRTSAGTPDADGRVMKSTIRASADEIASAAELALGKFAGRPVALVRGAQPLLGEGSIRDAIMPREFDLFG